MKNLLSIIILLLSINYCFGQSMEIPRLQCGDTLIYYTGFSLVYSEKHEQAKWVAYELTKEETIKLFPRTDKFKVDPRIKTGTASHIDYKRSGYDRGHMAPASDMGWSRITMDESFYYSNISPQKGDFNRKIWRNLEIKVREWAKEYESIYVVTGPVLTDTLKTIGPNGVSVPNYYYKVILDYKDSYINGIGFIMPNEGSNKPLEYYAVPIDSVEVMTGIDFFPMLDKKEECVEKSICIKCWSW